MPQGRLSALQARILVTLARIEPRWTLTGGGALVGFHAPHRTTRDLDLLWRGAERLESVAQRVEESLGAEGLEVDVLQSSPAFRRLEVRSGGETCVLDLVAEPMAPIYTPEVRQLEGCQIQVDSAHELLVNKLCALLGRAELRDLLDVRELLQHGGDLDRASAEASRKDGGYSAVTLAWVLQRMPLAAMVRVAAHPEPLETFATFRDELIERLTRSSMPG